MGTPVLDEGVLHGLLDEVATEIKRAGAKHGPESMAAPGHGSGKRLGILGEEVGEASEEVEHLVRQAGLSSGFGRVARATTYDNGSAERLREELLQVAAMAVAWAHALEVSGSLPDEASRVD